MSSLEDNAHDARDRLASLICRFGLLQGQALLHAAVEVRVDELAAAGGLSELQIAGRVWTDLVAGGETIPQALDRLQNHELPALVTLAEGGALAIARRREMDGRFVIERSDGGEESVIEQQLGEAWRLTVVAPRAAEQRLERGRSAWFWDEIRRFRRAFVEVGVASSIANLLALGASLFAMQVYDRVVPNAAYQTLWVLAAGLMVAVLFEFIIRAARAQLLDYACKKIDTQLSSRLFDQLLAVRMDARPKSIGTLAAQVRDFEVVRNFLTSGTLFVIADAPYALLFIGIIALIGGPIALVPLAALLITLVVGLLVQLPLAKLAQLHVQEMNERNGVLIEAIDGAESIKAAGAEWQLGRRWNHLTEQLAGDALKMRTVQNGISGFSAVVQQVSYAGIVIVGAYLIGDGSLTMGGLIACSILGGRVLSPVNQIVALAFQWHHARSALKTLNGVMGLPRDHRPDERPVVRESIAARLEGEMLTFAYEPDAPPAIRIKSLKIQPGERIALVGPTGSGKSTLLKLLTGLYSPSGGRLSLDGVDISQLDARQVRQMIGYLPQEIRLFHGTLRENLTLGLGSIRDDEVLQIAKLTGIDRFMEKHPRGMGLMLTEGGRGLSGGQRQSVALARVLLGRPKVLLLDEPTAAMDQALEMQIVRGVLQQLQPDQTLVWVTHKPALIHAAERIVVMDQGQIVLDGPRDAVLKRLSAPPPAGQPTAAGASA